MPLKQTRPAPLCPNWSLRKKEYNEGRIPVSALENRGILANSATGPFTKRLPCSGIRKNSERPATMGMRRGTEEGFVWINSVPSSGSGQGGLKGSQASHI